MPPEPTAASLLEAEAEISTAEAKRAEPAARSTADTSNAAANVGDAMDYMASFPLYPFI